MKRIVLTLAIAVSTLSAFAGEEVSPKVLNAFNNEFKTAKDVEWTIGTDYYRATFTYNEKHVFAYYNVNGELMGLTRYIIPADLPMLLQAELKSKYNEYWISDLFEVANSEGTAWYVTLEDADSKLVLKAIDAKSWNSYRKIKKT
jgi:hypothetical protein